MEMEMEIGSGDGTNELLEAETHLWNYIFNYVTSMSLKCAVQLGIPDIISNHDKPLPLSELVDALSVPQMKSCYVYRLMRILVHSGFFVTQKVHEDQEGYALTPSSKLLLKNHKTNLSPFLLMMLDPVVVTPFNFMSAWFMGKESSSFEAAFGTSFWDYLRNHPDFSMSFNKAMASDTEFVTSIVLKDHKNIFEGFNSLVDVGGGTGTLLNAMCEAFPYLKCTLFDLPHVVADIQGSENIQIIAGDMFEFIPSAEIILLKWVMHILNDEDCGKILKQCREALSLGAKGGKVIIIEIVMDVNKDKHESIESQLCMDILMMVDVTGKERTETEWEKLFLEAGFTSYKITPLLGLRSIIEIFP